VSLGWIRRQDDVFLGRCSGGYFLLGGTWAHCLKSAKSGGTAKSSEADVIGR